MAMDDTNLALLSTTLQYWQEVAKELMKNNKRMDAVRYIKAQTGCDLFEAVVVADQLKARLTNEDIAKEGEHLLLSDEFTNLHHANQQLVDALKDCIEICTLRGVYVGDFYRDAVKNVIARANAALAEHHEKQGN